LKGSPFVVKCFASTQDMEYLYLLLEYCSGGELGYHLQQLKKFNEEMIRCFFTQIGFALEQLHHKHKIIHRDLKPENILLDADGFCSIIDFNMAIKAPDDTLLIRNPKHQYFGTLHYIAPEMLAGKDYNHKVDWWSVGIMAFEFAYGYKPYSVSKGQGSTDHSKLLHSIKNTNINTCGAHTPFQKNILLFIY